MAQTCPQLVDVLNDSECLENLAGLGTDVYIGLKGDLKNKMTATENEYTTPEFLSGKGLYKLQCKDDSQQIQGSSLGERKGFELTCTLVIDSVNANIGKLMRAINNRDVFVITKDGDVSQILYDPTRKIKKESGALKTDTGSKPDDERTSTVELKQSPVLFPNLYVKEPEEGWDSLLASTAAAAAASEY